MPAPCDWPPEKMVLAGGTTLEMLWRHRESTDIDLFVSNATIIEIAKRGTAELERATARIDKVGKHGQAAAQEDWSKEQSRESHSQSRVATTSHGGGSRRQGCRETAVQCGTVEEVLSGKVLGRWVDRVKRGQPRMNGHRYGTYTTWQWRKPLHRTFCKAVVAKIGEGTRGRLAEWLEETPEEWTRKDPQRVLAGQYDVDNWTVAGQIAAAVRQNDIRKSARYREKRRGKDGKQIREGRRWT